MLRILRDLELIDGTFYLEYQKRIGNGINMYIYFNALLEDAKEIR